MVKYRSGGDREAGVVPAFVLPRLKIKTTAYFKKME